MWSWEKSIGEDSYSQMVERLNKFTGDDAFRPRWSPHARPRAVRWFAGLGVLLLGAALAGGVFASQATGAVYLAALLGLACSALVGVGCLAAAVAIQIPAVVGRCLLTFAFPIFLIGILGIIVAAWVPALLYEQVDRIVAFTAGGDSAVTVAQMQSALVGPGDGQTPQSGLDYAAACALWPLQFGLIRDVLAAVGVLGFVSICAMFAIWWERKVAGRIQSRLGPMRVGGWHGWAQSLADGMKLFQKEDMTYLAGIDGPLYRLAPYVAFLPALALFIALPFGAAWVCRDLDVGLIFIFAMVGLGVLGVLLAGWASNNKWSLFGAMREACQMVSYEIPLGFALLVPIMVAGTLRLTTIGELQAGGFHTWLAFRNPFVFFAALLYFVATLASCKRAPFDLPEAESELVAGFHTEYSGFRWCLFFFAEYAEMWAIGALAAILFFGAWHSPLPDAWGAAWAKGPLWQRALHGVLFGGPLWLICKGFCFVYVQMWLRWTLPRIRLDQVMYACVQVLLPLSMLVLLGQALWQFSVPDGHWLALWISWILAACGALVVIGFVVTMIYGLRHRRELVGTLVVDHLPGA